MRSWERTIMWKEQNTKTQSGPTGYEHVEGVVGQGLKRKWGAGEE